MAIAHRVEELLDRKQVRHELLAHPRAFSSKGSAHAAHIAEDHVAKAVIVKDKAGLAMVVIPANYWLKLHVLNQALDRCYILAGEAEAQAAFGDCAPGAIPPVGMAYGLETYLDEALCTLANVYFEAGDHEHLVHVSGAGFLQLLGGVRRGYFSD